MLPIIRKLSVSIYMAISYGLAKDDEASLVIACMLRHNFHGERQSCCLPSIAGSAQCGYMLLELYHESTVGGSQARIQAGEHFAELLLHPSSLPKPESA